MRAFTLIEILIVLVLLAAISAVTLPAVFGRFEDRAFETARTRVELAGMLCRADAIRSGELRELVAVTDGAGLTELFSARLVVEPDNGFEPGFDDELGVADDEPIRRLLVSLPEHVTITTRESAGTDTADRDDLVFDLPDDVLDDFFGAEPTPTSGAAGIADPAPLVIAVFLPDGTAQPVARHRIEQRSGRAATIEVGALTGGITTSEIVRAAGAEFDGFGDEPILGPGP
jgi:prepilin-type N-terminal cleavage/methylation domain-containing protein